MLRTVQRHTKTTQPVPVTIGGYHGLYLKLTAPADIDRCRRGIVTIFGAGGTWLRDMPSATFREWILNVHGQRVVCGTRIPDAANPAELIGMVKSAEFTGPTRCCGAGRGTAPIAAAAERVNASR